MIHDEVRQRIVSQAHQHFMTHGFRGVTMDELASDLGMSKKTLYSHFESKRLLLEAVVENKLRRVDEDLALVVAKSSTDFPTALEQLIACVRHHTEEIQPPFLRDLTRETPDLLKRVQTRRRSLFHKHIGSILGEGKKRSLIRKDVKIDLMIESLVGAADTLMNPQKLLELGISAKTCLSSIIMIFLEGVVVRKERENP